MKGKIVGWEGGTASPIVKLTVEVEKAELAGQVFKGWDLIDFHLQQEQPSEICSKCIHHGKDDGYCYNPHGGMQSLINENGVYECTGYCEQEQPDVDLEKIIEQTYHDGSVADTDDMDHVTYENIARHFYELGKKSK